MSHWRPLAQPFSCLPSPLTASQPHYSAPRPLGEAKPEPSRHRAPSLARSVLGMGVKWGWEPGPPPWEVSPARSSAPEGC